MPTNFSAKTISSIFLGLCLAVYFLGVYWSFEPNALDIKEEVTLDAQKENVVPVVGYTTTTALIRVSETLLNKPGGYLTNDALPPSNTKLPKL